MLTEEQIKAIYESRHKLEEYFKRDKEFAIENNRLNEELTLMASSGNANPSNPRFVEIMNRLADIVEERHDLFIKLHS